MAKLLIFLKITVIVTNYKKEKIVLLAKSKLNNIEVLISKALSDSNISHDEFVLINNMLKEFKDMKEEIKNFNDKKFKLYIKQCYLIYKSMLSCLKCRKHTESKKPKVVEPKMEEQCFYQNVQYSIIKTRNSLKSKKLEDY